MKVTRKHPFTGEENTLDLPITRADYFAWTNASGESRMRFAQNAFPHLSADQREFLVSGILPGEFDALFPEED